jgi:hypothetical protein
VQSSRADIVIAEGIKRAKAKGPGGLRDCTSAVIEMKRASTGKALINKDIVRLAELKACLRGRNPGLRAFLVLVSEARRPGRFVRQDGMAVRGKRKDFGPSVPGSYYRVRRVCKAAHSFKKKESAHYTCILEVFNAAARH